MIPDDAHFVATVRSFSPQARAAVQAAAPRLARDIAAAHGLTATAEFVDGYPVTVNDAGRAGVRRARPSPTCSATAGTSPRPIPLTGSEDFSYVLEQVPGAFLMLGACPPDADPFTAPFNHSAEAVFDDAVLPDGTAAVRRAGAAPPGRRLSRGGRLGAGSRLEAGDVGLLGPDRLGGLAQRGELGLGQVPLHDPPDAGAPSSASTPR